MPEYIDRELALEAAKKSHLYFSIKPIINNIPAADVRHAVLCKNCLFQQYCKLAQYLGEDGYCSNGEKREVI